MSRLSVIEKYEAAVAAHGDLISRIRHNLYDFFDDYGFLESYERQGECQHCGQPDSGYCWCVDCDDDCIEPIKGGISPIVWTAEGKRQLKLRRREAREFRNEAELRLERCIVLFRWELVRRVVRARGIGFFWFGEAVRSTCASDGAGRHADKAAFAAEFAAKAA